MPPQKPSESQVEDAITTALQLRGWLVIPITAERPDGGKRRKRHAMPGTPDLVALKDGKGVLIEVKRHGGAVRRSQEIYRAYAAKHGVAVILARSVEDLG